MKAEEGRTTAPPPHPGRDYVFRVYPLDDPSEVRLIDLWRTMWSRRWLIAACTAAFIVLSVVAALLIPPVFRSSVLVAPVTDHADEGGLASLAGDMGGLAALAGIALHPSNSTAEFVATLKSRAFTEQFIEEHGLMPLLFADLWNGQTQQWRGAADEIPTPWDAYDLFDDVRVVDEDVQTGLVTVSVDWPDAQLAARWVNWLIEDVNRTLRTKAIDESRRNLEFLRKQIDASTAVELRSVLYMLVETEMKNAMLANGKVEYAFKVIDPAVVAEKRHSPNRLLIVLLGSAAGLVLGVLTAFLRRAAPAAAPDGTDPIVTAR